MAITYTCDVCKKKTKEAVYFSMLANMNRRNSFRHICQKCWDSVIEFLRKKAKSQKKKG